MATKKTPAKKTVAKKAPAKKAVAKKVTKPKAEPKLKVKATTKTPKEIATESNEPWVSVIQVELDPDNIGNGAFELDWNDKFITKLVRAGYQKEPGEADAVIVDRWFQDICRNVLMENFEQWEANQPKEDRLTLSRRDLGDGRTEVS
jgi:hypothetical protein